MKIGLRGGHSPNCKGAVGYLDEQAEVRKIYWELVPLLQSVGHTVVNCNSDSNNVNGELSEGTNAANGNGCDIYVTLHMNASGGAGNGSEVWLYDGGNGMMNNFANRICNNFANKGFQNRGVKYNAGYHDLCSSNMPAMIVETLFCDNAHDADLYSRIGLNGIARMIGNGLDGAISLSGGSATPQPSPSPTPSPKPVQKPIQVAGDVSNDIGLTYRAHCQTLGWCDWVRDGQTAGTVGFGKRLEALQFDVNKLKKKFGGQIMMNVKAHIQTVGNKLYTDISNDTIIGTVGDEKRIEAIEIEIFGLPKDKFLEYEIHVQKEGWTGYTRSGFATGSTGMEKRIEAFRARIR